MDASFAGRLRGARQRVGWSTGSLAGAACLRLETVEALERGDVAGAGGRIRAITYLSQCAHVLGVPVSEVLGDATPRTALETRTGSDRPPSVIEEDSLPPTLGAALREVRWQRGLSMEQLVAGVGMKFEHLRALEADRHEELGRIRVHSYARSCALLLQIDPAVLLDRIGAPAEPSAGGADAAPATPAPWPSGDQVEREEALAGDGQPSPSVPLTPAETLRALVTTSKTPGSRTY
jgi:cytoskeletal protein RodZ